MQQFFRALQKIIDGIFFHTYICIARKEVTSAMAKKATKKTTKKSSAKKTTKKKK